MARKKKLISISDRGWRKKDPLPSILEEWYGEEEGFSEVASHLPDAVSIQDAIKGVMSSSDSAENEIFTRIRDEWEGIVGKDISCIALPRSLRNGILYVCVENSAWMMELRNSGKKFIIDKISGIYGKNSIKDINFIPSG
ncbi:MAG: hypothetical protein A2X48_17830 [Lentisphaerae bacterium GWF2_49_21]|nr:MAG: hypothetical protein A2X48_17830 [Lentisphaerae bacterium GWF2_49_21]